MKKGKIIVTITIGLVCVILVAVMFLQFKTINQTDITSLENMREDKLRVEIASYKTKNEEIEQKKEELMNTIKEYQESLLNETEASNLLKQELKQYNDLLGKNEVNGDGVTITLTDTRAQKINAEDLVVLLNDLKSAGAEAISINEQRIVYDSYVVDINNTYISVNGKRIVSPYVVKAIGNPSYLESALAKKQYGYIDTKLAEGKDVVLERENDIIIPKYIGNLQYEYVEK